MSEATEVKRARPLKPSIRAKSDDLFTEVPVAWNETYKLLARADFEPASQWHYYNWKADRAEQTAIDLRQLAVESKASGGVVKKSKANKYKLLMAKLAELEAELTNSGVDLDALKASMAS